MAALLIYLFTPVSAAAPEAESEPPLWQVALVASHDWDEPEPPKVVEPEPEPVKVAVEPVIRGVNGSVSVTMYGPTGNPMASGKMPYKGAVAASDRSIPFGTIVEIDGIKYVVEDRTARWIHEKHGLTFDIYSDAPYSSLLAFGRQTRYCTNTIDEQTWHCITEKKR